METTRRTLIAASAIAGALPSAAAAQPSAAHGSAVWHQAVLERFHSFGVKASGGPGDEACGAWLEGELTRLGYGSRRQRFDAPFFDVARATLASGPTTLDVIPQALVVATGAAGVTARLRRAEPGVDLSGAIALVVLPFKRWVTLLDPAAGRPIADAFARGARAVALVTTGPTGEAIALNVSPHRAGFDRPVVLLAPKASAPMVAAAAASREATLVVDGRGGQRSAWNLIARLDRGAAQTVVVSTPRSGWFGCTAERGSGVAVWLSVAHALAASRRRVNIELLCTSGHEYEYLGGEHYLEKIAPAPMKTKLWLHIGASAAARDWHELGGGLRPLPSPETQRVLTATANILHSVRGGFAGISGLEATYLADKASAGGELTNVLAAGYPSLIGLYGGHRYFHTPADDLRCTSGDLVKPVADAFRRTLEVCLAA